MRTIHSEATPVSWLSLFAQQGVLDGAIDGAIKGAIAGLVFGIVLVVVRMFKKSPADKDGKKPGEEKSD
jgi:hypothetical protein